MTRSRSVMSAAIMAAALAAMALAGSACAKFADEKSLEGSDINVDTTDHVVRLQGTVRSDAAKARASEIARGTERVTRVVDELVVKS